MQLPSPLDALPTTRREILIAIKMAGETSAELIAGNLGISAGATRQHLTAMRAARLVDLRESRDGPGRPRHLYFLAAGGEAMFPRSNADYLNGVLTAASELDPGLVDTLLRRMGRLRYEDSRERLDGRSFDERLELVRSIYASEGFLPLATRRSEGQYELTLYHCPIMDTATSFPSICDAELACVRESLDARTDVAEHRLHGRRVCKFVIDTGQAAS